MEKLQQILPEIQWIFSTAETLTVVNTHQANLLHQMKEVVYDAEDVIDEFNHRMLKAVYDAEDCVTDQFAAKVLTAGKRLVGMDQMQSSLSMAIKGLERVRRTADRFISVAKFEKITTDASRLVFFFFFCKIYQETL